MPKKGKHGGVRDGAGRPRSALPDDALEAIGDIPIGNPLGQARWYMNAIGVLTRGVLEGKPWMEMLATVRASAGAAGRVLPPDIIFEAAKIIEDSNRDMKNAGGVEPSKRESVAVIGKTGASRRDPH